MAEIGADQQPHFAFQHQPVEPELGLNLGISFFEDFLDLPVPVSKIAQDRRQFAPHRAHIETDDIVRQTLHPIEVRARCLPGEMERPHDDPRRVGVEPQVVLNEVEGVRAPNGFSPSKGAAQSKRADRPTPIPRLRSGSHRAG